MSHKSQCNNYCSTSANPKSLLSQLLCFAKNPISSTWSQHPPLFVLYHCLISTLGDRPVGGVPFECITSDAQDHLAHLDAHISPLYWRWPARYAEIGKISDPKWLALRTTHCRIPYFKVQTLGLTDRRPCSGIDRSMRYACLCSVPYPNQSLGSLLVLI
jgi:hypothetical protein